MRQRRFFLPLLRPSSESKATTNRRLLWLALSLAGAIFFHGGAFAQGLAPGQNINMVSGTQWPDGDPFLQRQNEPSIAVSTRNACHLLAGANDYRTVDLNFLATGETGDAWLGLFKSFDCGATWQSTLLPGYRLDQTPEGRNSPLKLWSAASDPIVRSGPSGFFGYSGIAFNRGTNNGVVFFSRFIDLNDKENGTAATGAVSSNKDPIRFIGTSVVATGSATRFLDKPSMIIDITRDEDEHDDGCRLQVPQPGAPGGTVSQTVAVGNIYMAFTQFDFNQMGTVTSSQILFSRSTDCGVTWSRPINLTARDDLSDRDQDSLNQGPIIQVDPQTGWVYVAWRRFATAEHSDAMIAAASFNGGTSFTPGVPIVTLPRFDPNNPPTGPNGPYSFFDQQSIDPNPAMRILTFPALAVEDSGIRGIPGRIFLAWSQRGVGPNGEARIMMVASPTSWAWPKPFPVDNGSVLDDVGDSFPRGHQFMPQMTFVSGKLMVLYYDLRLDHTLGVINPVPTPQPDAQGRFVLETRDSIPETGAPIVTPFLDDSGLKTMRHTVEVQAAQYDPNDPAAQPLGPGSFKTSRVTQFAFGTRGDNSAMVQQLSDNPPNLPMFQGGTKAFFGDYLDIAGQSFIKKGRSWVYNSAPTKAPVFYGTWTDNRDVQPPLPNAQGVVDWTSYTPINLFANGQPSIFDPNSPRPSTCNPGSTASRNQNIYSSRITQGLTISSPQNSKPLSPTVQRAFVIDVRNFTNLDKSFRLSIANQLAGGFASFIAGINNPLVPSVTPPSPVTTSVDVTIAAHSGITRSIFAVSSSSTASIQVNVDEISAPGAGGLLSGGLSSSEVLNADGTVPALIDPDGVPAGTSIAGVEVYSPNVSSPNVSSPNVSSPNVSSPNVSSPNVSSPNVSSPNVSSQAFAATVTASGVEIPNVSSPNVSSPNVSSPNVSSPNVSSPNVSSNTLTTNAPVSDASYSVTNAGNTSASYHIRLVGDPTLTASNSLQLLVNKVYATPVATGCELGLQQANVLLANVTNPVIQPNLNPSDTGATDPSISNTTFALAPGETALVTLRGFNVDVSTMQNIVNAVTPAVVSHAANTNDPTNTPAATAPLFILPATLPDAVSGQAYNPPNGVPIQVIGGVPPYNWGASSGNLPAGLTLNAATGVISGAPNTAAGAFLFTVQVTDSAAPGHVTARAFTIRVADPLVVATVNPLPQATVGVSYGPVTFAVNGGIGPFTWTPAAVDGLTFNSSGVLSGTPTSTGTFSFTAGVADSASPMQKAGSLMSVSVVPATPPPPATQSALIFDNFNSAAVTQQAGGPPNPTTFVLASTTQITQLATYHFNNGQGAAPGTIGLQNQAGQIFGPYAAVGVAGQGGPNEAWVASPNVILPAGTYTVIDSSPATWSFNATSSNSSGQVNCGFARVWASAQRQLVPLVTDRSTLPLSNSFGVPSNFLSLSGSFAASTPLFFGLNQTGDYSFTDIGGDTIFLVPHTSSTPVRVLQIGDPVPGFPGSVVNFFNGFALNNSGVLAFDVDFFTSAGGSQSAVFTYNGSFHEIADSLQVAPGSGGALFQPFLSLVGVNDSGDVAFATCCGANETIYIAPGGGAPVRVAGPGDAAAGVPGATFSSVLLANQPMNNSGQLLFEAGLTGGPGGDGLFVGAATGVRKVVANGDPVPVLGGLFNTQFFDLSGGRLNNAGQVAFVANDSLWVNSAAAGTTLVVGVNSPAPAPVGGTFSSLTGFGACSTTCLGFVNPMGFDDAGDIAFEANLASGTSNFGLFRFRPANSANNTSSTSVVDVVAYASEPTSTQTILDFDAFSINTSGTISFRASLSGAPAFGIFQQPVGGGLTPLILDGQTTPIPAASPGTYSLNSFSYPFFSGGFSGITVTLANGAVYFPADVVGGTADYGEFLTLAGGTRVLMDTAETLPAGAKELMRSSGAPRTTGAGDFVSLVPGFAGGRQSLAVHNIKTRTTTVVLTDGDVVPGVGRIRIAQRESVNANGSIINLADIIGGGQALVLASPGGVSKVVATGDLDPTTGQTFVGFPNQASFYHPTPLNNLGQVVFCARLSGGPAAIYVGSGGTSPVKVAGDGDPAPGGGAFGGPPSTPTHLCTNNVGASGQTHSQGGTINQLGQVAFAAVTNNGGVASQGIFLWTPSPPSLVKIGAIGDASPGGGTFSAFGRAVLNDVGEVAFEASINGAAARGGVFAATPGNITALALDGTTAPAGGNFSIAPGPSNVNPSGFTLPPNVLINNQHDVVFLTSLTGGSAASGLFVRRGSTITPGNPSGTLQKVAVLGDPAPGTTGGTFFNIQPPNFPSQIFQLDAIGNISFEGAFQAGNTFGGGLWHFKTDNTLEPILVSGTLPPEFGGGTVVGDFASFFWNSGGRYALWSFVSGGSFGNGILLFVQPSFAATPAGANVVVQPNDATTNTTPVTLTFADVTTAGGTSLETSSSGPTIPAAFTLGTPPVFYNLSSTAVFTGSIAACIDFTGISFAGPSPRLLNFLNGTWTDVTTSLSGSVVCGQVSALSPFTVATLH